jgi:hypothetical protein
VIKHGGWNICGHAPKAYPPIEVKWIQTYATRNAIICEALWHWQQKSIINLILMGGLFGVVLPI